MATTTTRLGLSKPASTDLVDIAVLNGNFDKTDAAAGAFVCTSTTRPSTPYSGQIIYETDTSRSLIWNSAMSTWLTLVPGSTVCTSSSRPSSPVAGQVIYETDTKLTYVYASGSWAPVLNDKGLSQYTSIKVADAAARDALFTSPTAGDMVSRADNKSIEQYDGTSWKIVHLPPTAYVPTITGATRLSGSLYYSVSGHTLFISGKIVVSAVSGNVVISFPTGFTANASAWVTNSHAGSTLYLCAGSTSNGFVRYSSATAMQCLVINVAGTYGAAFGLSSTVPATWVSGDSISITAQIPLA